MKAFEINAVVKLISDKRTEQLGFGCAALSRMIKQVFPIIKIDRFGVDRMFLLNGIWIAEKDCEVYEEDTVESIKPPTLMFDVRNLVEG